MGLAIHIENVSKRYLIGHNHRRLMTFRDRLTTEVRRMSRRLTSPFTRIWTADDQQDPHDEVFWALRDISFDVRQGERFGIIGRNGAGKSTLLKVLSRITEPTTGRIGIKGRVASLLEVGTGFHPELTGRENIFFNGAVLGMTKFEIKKKFDGIVDFSGVERFLETPVKRYSSGMYVRLAFAVAAHLEPEILIIDEVLAVGDAGFQKKCLGKMRDLGETGRTVLFVSHNMAAVKTLCSKALLIEGGRIEAQGSPEGVIACYLGQSLGTNNRFQNSDPRPESLVIRIVSARVQVDGADLSVSIEIGYEVVAPRVGAVLAVRITDQFGVVVTTLLDTDADLGRFEKCPGLYETVCCVPGDLLQPGLYFVTLSISDMKSTRYEFLENVMSFSIPFNQSTQNTFAGREGSLLLVSSWPLKRLDE